MRDIYSWQQSLWQQLTQKRHLQSHALLFKGRQGIGKLDFAQNLAKWLLCSLPTDQHQACGTCSSCNWFEQNGHPNFYEITPEALTGSPEESLQQSAASEQTNNTKTKRKPSLQINIGQIRQLSDFIYLSGHQSSYKIILIHPAENMNQAAANALLKKLEEPPAQVLFILVSHRPQQLLPTVRSRCQQIIMPLPDPTTAIGWLKQKGIPNPENCLAAAGYAPLLAATTSSNAEYHTQYTQFISQLTTQTDLDPIALAQAMQNRELPTLVSWLQKWCYDILSYGTTGNIRYNLDQSKTIQRLAKQIDPKVLVTYSRQLIATQQLARHPLNTRLFLEDMLFSYLQILNTRSAK